MADDNITDISDARSKRGRPAKTEVEKSDFKRPQTVSFLAAITGMDRRTIERKLQGVAPAERQGKSDLYALNDALEALYKSQTGLSAQALSELDPTQLPPITQAAFWGAQKARIAVYRDAKEVFHAEDILKSHYVKDKIFRSQILAIPEKVRMAQKNGISLDEVAREILDIVVEKSAEALEELTGKSYSAKLLEIERQAEAGDADA